MLLLQPGACVASWSGKLFYFHHYCSKAISCINKWKNAALPAGRPPTSKRSDTKTGCVKEHYKHLKCHFQAVLIWEGSSKVIWGMGDLFYLHTGLYRPLCCNLGAGITWCVITLNDESDRFNRFTHSLPVCLSWQAGTLAGTDIKRIKKYVKLRLWVCKQNSCLICKLSIPGSSLQKHKEQCRDLVFRWPAVHSDAVWPSKEHLWEHISCARTRKCEAQYPPQRCIWGCHSIDTSKALL